jgi:MFS family permease
MSSQIGAAAVRTLVPARLDRLPWTRFHWRVITGLGAAWILDGLEIQIVALAGTVLQEKGTLHLSAADALALGSIYLGGEVVGALVFGLLTDILGRRRLFLITLLTYLIASGLAALSPNYWVLAILRFIAGTGIGGEYTAINSAIDELIPSHYRGRTDIVVNGTYWAGAMIGAAASIFLFNPNILPIDIGWRVGFVIGPVIGIAALYLRYVLPESPRWLMTHGRVEEAERIVDQIEDQVKKEGVKLEPVPESKALEVTYRGMINYIHLARVVITEYPDRTFLGFTMMVTQAFLYNAIFFSQGSVLKNFYGIPSDRLGVFFFPFAAGNLLGPLLIGHFFDTVGRRKMITLTYCGSGILLAISAFFFSAGALNAITQTAFWCGTFFLASAGASSAYLTVSEIFPLELRAQAIALFFAISQLAGGVAAPYIFGLLIGNGTDRTPLTIGYLIGGAVMFFGGVVAWFFGVDAERKSLEDIAIPLSAVTKPAAVSPGTATGK